MDTEKQATIENAIETASKMAGLGHYMNLGSDIRIEDLDDDHDDDERTVIRLWTQVSGHTYGTEFVYTGDFEHEDELACFLARHVKRLAETVLSSETTSKKQTIREDDTTEEDDDSEGNRRLLYDYDGLD